MIADQMVANDTLIFYSSRVSLLCTFCMHFTSRTAGSPAFNSSESGQYAKAKRYARLRGGSEGSAIMGATCVGVDINRMTDEAEEGSLATLLS